MHARVRPARKAVTAAGLDSKARWLKVVRDIADESLMIARPNPIHWGSVGGGSVGWILASAAFLSRFHGPSLAIVGGLDAVLVTVIGVLIAVLRPRQCVAVEGTTLHVRGLIRSKVFDRNDLSKIVQLNVRISGDKGRSGRPAWLVLDRAGIVVVKLNRRAWNTQELDLIRHQLGLEGETIPGELEAANVNEAYPGALYWWTLHPTKSGVLAFAVILALALLIHFAS